MRLSIAQQDALRRAIKAPQGYYAVGGTNTEKSLRARNLVGKYGRLTKAGLTERERLRKMTLSLQAKADDIQDWLNERGITVNIGLRGRLGILHWDYSFENEKDMLEFKLTWL